jgi:hypothetical protein
MPDRSPHEPPDHLLVERLSEALGEVDGSLRLLISRLPSGDRSSVSALRGQLLDAGVTEARVAQCLRMLLVLVSDETLPASERLGLGPSYECSFCGEVPLPKDLVIGKSASICRSCAVARSAGEIPADEDAALAGLYCGFCGMRWNDPAATLKFRSAGAAVLICAECLLLALDILADLEKEAE